MTGYCLKCRDRREIQSPQQVTMKNGRPATRGTCGDCGTTVPSSSCPILKGQIPSPKVVSVTIRRRRESKILVLDR